MFDIAWSEMVVIGAVALIAIGPKDLPKALRAVGAMTAKARRMAAEFQDHFREAMREAELESVQQEVANIKQDLAATTSGLQSEFNSIGQQATAQPAETPQDTVLKVETGKVETADIEPPKSETASDKTASDKTATDNTPAGMSEAPLSLAGAAHSTDAKETPKPATTLSVEARPDMVAVTETAVAANGHAEAPTEKPARKKRVAKPKAKAEAKSEAKSDATPPSDLLQVANGAPAPVKAPRKRTPKAATKVSSAKAPQAQGSPAEVSAAEVSPAEVSPAKDVPANTFPSGDDRAA